MLRQQTGTDIAGYSESGKTEKIMRKRMIRVGKIILIFALLLSMVVPENILLVKADHEAETSLAETEEFIDGQSEMDVQREAAAQEDFSAEEGTAGQETSEGQDPEEKDETSEELETSQLQETIIDENADLGTEETVSSQDINPAGNSGISDNTLGENFDSADTEPDSVIVNPEEMEGTFVPNSMEESTPEGWGDIEEEDRLLLASYSNVPKGIWLSGIKDATYTGEEITFSNLKVYDENILLVEGRDYEISYSNNINAATEDSTNPPLILLKGLGNYQGQIQTRFTIKPTTLLSTGITAEDVYMKYTGETIYPIVEIVHNSKKLENKKDFIFDIRTTKNMITDAVEAGTYHILITGVGNYTGTRTIKLYVTNGVMMDEVEFSPIEPQSYTGKAIKPEVVMTYEGKNLLPGTDYTVKYADNTEAGIATVIITGKGNFAGVREETFEITGISMQEVDVYDLLESYFYTGSEIKPPLRVYYSRGSSEVALSTQLKLNTDYKLTYENNKQVGLATITIQGKGKYNGTIIKNFEIKQYDFNSEDGNLRISSEPVVSYMKGGCKPEVKVQYYGNTLTEGTDYTLKYSNISEAGNTKDQPTIIITGQGNYTGVLTRNFIINVQDISNLEVLAPDMVYNRKVGKTYHATCPIVYDLDGKTLSKGVDYKITGYYYKNRTVLEDSTVRMAGDKVKSLDRMPVGTILLVNIEGTGNYSGSASASYKIVTKDMSKAKVTISDQYYTGAAITPGKNQITVKLGSRILRSCDYEIITYYDNVEKGTAKILIHGIGNFGGYVTGKFSIKVRDIKGNGVNFNGNGATGGKMAVMRLSSLETGTVLYPNAYVRKGYEFTGWNTKEDGTGIPYQDCGTITFPADKNGIMITLYAQWQPYAYSITYYLNGGTNHSKNPSFYRYNADDVVFQAPIKAGYDFAGWYQKKNFKKPTPEIQPGTMKNITLYAKWKVKAPIIASANKTAEGYNHISFTSVLGASKYVVYRSTKADGTYVKIGITKSTEYTDQKIKKGKVYYYKIKAYSSEKEAKGYSDYSQVIGVGGN